MMPSITPLGKRWEVLHSIWLVWLLFIYKHGYLSFMAFFYIGIRARKWKWILSGCMYLIVVSVFLLVKFTGYVEHPIFDIILGIMLFSYITSWVHAFWARKEYLQIIAERKIAKKPIKEKRKKNQGKVEIKKVKQYKTLPVIPKNTEPIYINSASESEIAVITGPEIAKEIMEARKRNGDFTSILDLIRLVQIKPHLMVQMKKQFIFDRCTEKQGDKTKGKAERSSGRMVDY